MLDQLCQFTSELQAFDLGVFRHPQEAVEHCTIHFANTFLTSFRAAAVTDVLFALGPPHNVQYVELTIVQSKRKITL